MVDYIYFEDSWNEEVRKNSINISRLGRSPEASDTGAQQEEVSSKVKTQK